MVFKRRCLEDIFTKDDLTNVFVEQPHLNRDNYKHTLGKIKGRVRNEGSVNNGDTLSCYNIPGHTVANTI